MAVESAEDLASFFGAAEFAKAASYTPPGGGPATPCAVLVVAPDEEWSVGRTSTVAPARVVEVRRAQVAAPAENGTLTTFDDLGAVTGVFRVASVAVADDDGLIWRMEIE